MEESYAKAHGYDILGIVGDYAEVGCDPQYMGYAPFYAVEKLLDKTDSKIDDVDIVEMTEHLLHKVYQSKTICIFQMKN